MQEAEVQYQLALQVDQDLVNYNTTAQQVYLIFTVCNQMKSEQCSLVFHQLHLTVAMVKLDLTVAHYLMTAPQMT